jgi:hypothetical protein
LCAEESISRYMLAEIIISWLHIYSPLALACCTELTIVINLLRQF